MPNPIFLLFSSLTYHTVLFKQFSEKYGIINIITVLPPIWSSENGFTLLLGFTAQDCTKKWLAVPHYICKNVLVFSVFLFVCRWDEREEGTRVPAARWGVPGIPESQVANMRKGKGDREQDIQMVTKWDGERWRLKTNTSLPAFMLSVVKSRSLPSHLSDSQMIAWTNAGFAQAVNLFFSFYTCYSFDG